ncbi:MAG: ribosome silencing factor [Alphaproteobacteria bacterium]|nr:ribosome silencing factor [Alphaproteobacteria bacterium]
MKKITAIELCRTINETLDQHKAQDICVIDLEGKSSIGDFMLIATGTSMRHLNALATYAQEKAKSLGFKNTTLEGAQNSGWVILDLGDVVVHLFLKETRTLYDLESMWDPSLYQRTEEKS